MAEPEVQPPMDQATKDRRDAAIRKIIIVVVIVLVIVVAAIWAVTPSNTNKRMRQGSPTTVDNQAWNLNDDSSQNIKEFTRSASAKQEESESQLDAIKKEIDFLKKENLKLRSEITTASVQNQNGGGGGEEAFDRTKGIPPEYHPYIPDLVRMLDREAIDHGTLDPRPSAGRLKPHRL